ncbi:MAG: hypothetical protein ACLTMD_08450 [Clostridium sp.]
MVCILLAPALSTAASAVSCALWSLYRMFSPITLFGVKVDENSCTGCSRCMEL